jgi:ABC-2 type transport system ATP-binding protein
MNDEYAIFTDKLTRRFGDVVAVDELDLAVKPGEVFGLVGPDGAGKTTTIRLLAAIMIPTSGRATVAGFDSVEQAEAIKARIGYMAQRFNLYDDLTVVENLEFFADVFEVYGAERTQRLERLLRFARLTEFRDRRAAHLSGGMQKKLALACTLIHEPQVLLLDEPTTGVDPVSRREFWDILLDLHLRGITIFVSTPYMDEAERCSRVGLIYQGRLIVCDAPEQIKGSIREELIEVRPDDLRQASTLIASLPGVSQVQTYGDLLHIFVDDARRRMPEVERHLTQAGIRVEGMRQTQPRMEEVFISIVRKRSEER